MIADRQSDERERELINHMLATIKERVEIAKRLSAAQAQDDQFTRERFDDMAAELELAYKMIKRLSRAVEAMAAELPPQEVIRALSSRSGKAHAVSATLNGKIHTFLVPSMGMDDPAEWMRWWKRFTERYGDA
ncbi:hypothetical protein ABZ897_00355 [Nonomuraea sp. NPDC046802]|uniref:hypothetical protein n=1 Tax=Nonomuraea sp. NPDC046802 TaxID=3154919 RepID=UPI0033DE7F98